MKVMSKNTFSISGDKIYITRPEWNYMACAMVRDDYAEEIQNATWGLNNERYLYNQKLDAQAEVLLMDESCHKKSS